MAHEQWVARFVDLTHTARPEPRPGWEARALAAMAAARPRRHPNLLTVIVVAVLILLLAAALFAAVRHFFTVEGTLQFHDARWEIYGDSWQASARYLTGDVQWTTREADTSSGAMSPSGDEIVFAERLDWPPESLDLLLRKLDGSAPINLTQAASIGGVNCKPSWSPDGSMIAFQHADPVEGQLPCRAGFHLWVMNADGSEAHRVTPEGSLPTCSGGWSPDGSVILTYMEEPWEGGREVGAILTDIWGTQIQVLPNVGAPAAWSPDGSMIVSCSAREDQVNGQPGWWNQLLLTDADGANPRVLVEQFLVDAEIQAHHPEDSMHERRAGDHWLSSVRHWAGPVNPVWSPRGDKIAFLAALPFDPDGPYYKHQIEVWVYDLNTDELTQITDDDVGQLGLIWR